MGQQGQLGQQGQQGQLGQQGRLGQQGQLGQQDQQGQQGQQGQPYKILLDLVEGDRKDLHRFPEKSVNDGSPIDSYFKFAFDIKFFVSTLPFPVNGT